MAYNNGNVSLTVLEARSLKSRWQQGCALSGGSRGTFFLASSTSGDSRPSLARGHIAVNLPLSSQGLLLLIPLCVSSSTSYKETCHIGLTQIIQGDLLSRSLI